MGLISSLRSENSAGWCQTLRQTVQRKAASLTSHPLWIAAKLLFVAVKYNKAHLNHSLNYMDLCSHYSWELNCLELCYFFHNVWCNDSNISSIYLTEIFLGICFHWLYSWETLSFRHYVVIYNNNNKRITPKFARTRLSSDIKFDSYLKINKRLFYILNPLVTVLLSTT